MCHEEVRMALTVNCTSFLQLCGLKIQPLATAFRQQRTRHLAQRMEDDQVDDAENVPERQDLGEINQCGQCASSSEELSYGGHAAREFRNDGHLSGRHSEISDIQVCEEVLGDGYGNIQHCIRPVWIRRDDRELAVVTSRQYEPRQQLDAGGRHKLCD